MARTINFGKETLSIKYPPLSKSVERDLIGQYQKTKDPKILNKLVMHNVSYVIREVGRCYRTSSKENRKEIIQEGIIGLIKAIEKFDLDKTDNKLCAYGRFWIHAYIQKYYEEHNTLIASELVRHEDEVVTFCNYRDDSDNMEAIHSLKNIFNKLDRPLSSHEQAILNHRWLCDSPDTLEQVGQKIGMTRQGVSLIETKLLKDLRKCAI